MQTTTHKNSSPNSEKTKNDSTTSGSQVTKKQDAPYLSVNSHEVNVTESDGAVEKKNVAIRAWMSFKLVVFSSYLNLLLVLVPAGIAAKYASLRPEYVFGINAAAIVPLAGLLSHATESVAQRMGDTVGALMNVTFGNAVELIIFIIALQKNELRIVQASLLGSILANLLLILGMCFLIGGLRYREQLYNSKITQMSACLLSLSVMSLLLPTAFHASFSNSQKSKATIAVLKVSRGTSVVLLLVYGMYLLFQLKSHAYMYRSTPQHIIDEEAAPGPVAAWIEHASINVSPSASDSDISARSHFTITTRRVKRAMRKRSIRRSRNSTTSSQVFERGQSLELQRKPSTCKGNHSPCDPTFYPEIRVLNVSSSPEDNTPPSPIFRRISIFEDENRDRGRRKERRNSSKKKYLSTHNSKNVSHHNSEHEKISPPVPAEPTITEPVLVTDIIKDTTAGEDAGTRRPLRLLNFATIPKSLSQNVFTNSYLEPTGPTNKVIPNVRYGVRRTNSLPLNPNVPHQGISGARIHTNLPNLNLNAANDSSTHNPKKHENVSRTSSVFLLLVSTGLVALCAEFMVDSINAVVKKDTGLSEAFIGLIILPIVGNAAEHVTAVTVATKNKMDLAIGVALGSSIQIALFVTPFIVLLGWCMDKDLSLLFTLFETVSLFVSAFIVNFLVLDGRSNYLEGALLCAAYIMIAVAAFFYPSVQESSSLGGNSSSPETVNLAINLVARRI